MKHLAIILAALTFAVPAMAQDAPGHCVITQKAAKAVAKKIHAEFCVAMGSPRSSQWVLDCVMPSRKTRQFKIRNSCPVKVTDSPALVIWVTGLGPVTFMP